MYKLENITEADCSLSFYREGGARITCDLGGILDIVLRVDILEHAYMVTMTEATIDGVMVHFHRSTARVSAPHGLVNFITQQLPVFNFDDVTVDTITDTACNAWRAPSDVYAKIEGAIQ